MGCLMIGSRGLDATRSQKMAFSGCFFMLGQAVGRLVATQALCLRHNVMNEFYLLSTCAGFHFRGTCAIGRSPKTFERNIFAGPGAWCGGGFFADNLTSAARSPAVARIETNQKRTEKTEQRVFEVKNTKNRHFSGSSITKLQLLHHIITISLFFT